MGMGMSWSNVLATFCPCYSPLNQLQGNAAVGSAYKTV